MGIAVGCCGISWSELDHITVDELSLIVESWHEYQEQLSRERWEQTRIMCLYSLAPHSKKPLKPKDVFELGWDKHVPVGTISKKSDFDAAKRKFGV